MNRTLQLGDQVLVKGLDEVGKVVDIDGPRCSSCHRARGGPLTYTIGLADRQVRRQRDGLEKL